MNIEEIFPDGELQGDEYIIRCFYCPDGDHPTHNHLSINQAKKVFRCLRCGETGTLRRLLANAGKYMELEPRAEVIEKKKYPAINFSSFPQIKKDNMSMSRMAYTYVTKRRGITDQEIAFYDIRYATEGKFYGRILIPICEGGRVVCFSARSFFDFIKPKYLFPHYGQTPLTAGEAIFGYDRAVKECPEFIILVEGVFDAIAVNKAFNNNVQGLAIMSDAMTDSQLYKIMKLPKKSRICILLDATARKEAIKVAKKFVKWSYFLDEPRVAFLKKGDPASVTGRDLAQAVFYAKPFSFDLEMKIGMED